MHHAPRLLPLTLLLLWLPLLGLGCGDDQLAQPDAVIAITYPPEGALINTTRPALKGTARNVDQILVDGQPVSVVGGAWEVQVPLREGSVTVTATARGASETRTFRIDATPPLLEIISPKRASLVAPVTRGSGEMLVVQGRATDATSALGTLSVNGQVPEVDAEGNFTLELFARRGVNLIEVEAIDEAGNSAQTLMGVLYGEATDPGERLTNALEIAAYQDSIDALEQVVQGYVTPALVNDLLKTSMMLPQGVTVKSLDFDPVAIDIVPKSNPVDPAAPGFLEFTLDLKNIKLAGDFTLSGNDLSLDVSVAQTTLVTKLDLGADGKGGLSVGFRDAELDLPQGALKWTVKAGGASLSEQDSKVLKDLVERLARDLFASLLDERVIEQLYDPKLLNREITLLGRTLALALEIRKVTINSDGLFLQTDIALKPTLYPDLAPLPGALNLPVGRSNTPALDASVRATSDLATLNRLLHAVWQSGLIHQSLEGADFAGLMELPVALEAGPLAVALDGRVNNYADPTSPAGVTLRPQLPPILELRPGEEGGSGLKLRLPELHVDLMLNVDTAPVKLVTYAMFLDLGVNLVVKDSTLGFEFDVDARADLIDEPLFDLDDGTAEGLINGILAFVPTVLGNSLNLTGEAEVTWLKISKPQVRVHGLEHDHVSLGLKVEAISPK